MIEGPIHTSAAQSGPFISGGLLSASGAARGGIERPNQVGAAHVPVFALSPLHGPQWTHFRVQPSADGIAMALQWNCNGTAMNLQLDDDDL